MKTKLFIFPLLLIFPFLTCCGEKKEDGNIQDWVGTYKFSTNVLEHWYYSMGNKTHYEEKDQNYQIENDHDFVIREDKTWIFPEAKDPNLGKKGKIKCYKNYINLLGMNLDYNIRSTYKFELKIENSGTYLYYLKDTSSGRHGDHYDFTIRRIYFKLK